MVAFQGCAPYQTPHLCKQGMGFDKLRYIALLLLQQPNIVDSQNFSFPQGYATEPAALPGNPSPLGLALVKVAGGDRALLNAFRAVEWTSYQEANCPCGADEQGMDRWWAEQLTQPA